MNKIKYIAAVLIAIAGFGLQQAKADTFHSVLDAGNSGINTFTGPYGTVDIVLTGSNTATVTFTSGMTATNVYMFGGAGAVALNVNALSFSTSNIVGTNSGINFTPGPLTQGAAGNEDGFGSFNLTIDSFDGNKHSSDLVTFTLTNTSGTWASAADVLTPNGSGFDAAAHIFISATNPANGKIDNPSTGFAAETGGNNNVPDGGTTVMLLGLGLGSLGMARRFLKR